MAKILVNTKRYCHLIDESEIVFCKSKYGKTIIVLTSSKEISVYKSLQFLHQQLNKETFIFTHRAYIINLIYLESIHHQPTLHVEMINGQEIPIASVREKEVIELVNKNLKTQIIK